MAIVLDRLLVTLAVAVAVILAQEVPINSPIPGSYATPFQLTLTNGSSYR